MRVSHHERARGARRGFRAALILMLVPAVPAVFTGWLHPRAPDWSAPGAGARSLAIGEAMAMRDALWVDAREPAAFARAHVPGAVNLSETNWESGLPELLDAWRPGRALVVYCDGGECLASRQVAARIRRELEIDDVFVLDDGWRAWRTANAAELNAAAGEGGR